MVSFFEDYKLDFSHITRTEDQQ